MMTSKQILGLMLRDDHFLNIMAEHPLEEINNIWQQMVGRDVDSGGKRAISTTNKSLLNHPKIAT